MSAETKWPPGPWTIDRDPPDGPDAEDGRPQAILGASGYEVCSLHWTDEEDVRSVAYLLAASPELYSELDRLAGLLQRLNDSGRLDALGTTTLRLDDAGAVLAKARGEA